MVQPDDMAATWPGTPDALPTVMMLKALSLTALAFVVSGLSGLSGSVALADRGRGGDHRGASFEHRPAPQHRVHDHHDRHRGGGRVVAREHRDWYGGGRVIVRNEARHHRRPIYVSRPVIRERYYNYDRRPAVIVENYNPVAGYSWVAGGWTWNGYEWVWLAGHYEPDPSYVDRGYGGY